MIEIKTIYPVLVIAMSILPITFGFLLLLFAVPKGSVLQTYRTSRKALSFAYIIFGLLNIMEAIFMRGNAGEDRLMLADFCLIIASFQAFLFTISLIILIDPGFVSKSWKTYQLCCIAGLSAVTIIGFNVESIFFKHLVLVLFSGFYLYQLFFYTRLFLQKKKLYIQKVERYFSGTESKWLKWINIAFFSALSIGIGAFFLIIFTSQWFNLVFTIICFIFYFLFAVKYLEYPQLFQRLQPVIVSEQNNIPDISIGEQQSLEHKLNLWICKKSFLEENITIDHVAQQLEVNRLYLSFHIQAYLQMDFKSWLNYLKQREQQLSYQNHVTQSDNCHLFERLENMISQQKLFLDVEITRDELARKLHTNTRYLCEAIKEKMDMTFGEYVNNLRLDHAHKLLVDSDERSTPILVIALSSGFKSLRTFNRAFKEKFGISPKEVRNTFVM